MRRNIFIVTGLLLISSYSYSQNTEKQKIGVTLHKKAKTDDDYRFYSSRNLTAAHLISPDGHYVHTWYYPHDEDAVTSSFGGFGMTWHFAEMMPNGNLLAVVKDEMIIELDWNSNLVWKTKLRAHHDFARDKKGNTVVVSRRDLPDPWHEGQVMAFDELVEFNKKGDTIRIWHYEEHMDEVAALVKEPLPPFAAWGDWPHINTCEILPENPIAKKDKRFKAGNLLLCGRHANTIMIVERKSGKVVWAWGPGVIEGPHMPTMLANGNILIYDNGNHTSDNSRGYTKAIEIDPLTGQIVWEYGSNKEFFSPARGSAVRMTDGNTLIANSDNGWFFEVTPEGEKVWEYYNPDLTSRGSKMGLYRTLAYEKTLIHDLVAKNGNIYFERNGRDEFTQKYDLSEKLLEVVNWVESGDLDRAHTYIYNKGMAELGAKEGHFVYSFLFAVRKDVKKSMASAAKSIGAGMPKAAFSLEFSDLFKPIIDHPKFGDL